MTPDSSPAASKGALARVVDIVDRLTLGVSSLGVALFSAVVVYVALGRYVFGTTPYWSEELPRSLLIWSVFIGLVPATVRASHLNAGLLPLLVRNARRRRGLEMVARLLTALFFAILIDPNQPATFSARLTAWDYVVGVVGVAAALILAGALFAAHRSRQAREQGFGDSLRDHLRRRIAQLDAEAAGERRLALTTVVTTLICATAVSILEGRIRHVPVPWNEIVWPSPFKVVLILGFLYLLFFRWMPREWQRRLSRKRQLETLLKELDE